MEYTPVLCCLPSQPENDHVALLQAPDPGSGTIDGATMLLTYGERPCVGCHNPLSLKTVSSALYLYPLRVTPRQMLMSHTTKVVGMVFIEGELEVVTGSADATFLVWHVPALTLKQRFTRCSSSPMVGVVETGDTPEVRRALPAVKYCLWVFVFCR